MAEKKEEQTAAKLPDSIVIGGVTYKVAEVPELQQFIAQVSQVEKAKLHTKFASLQERLNDLDRQAGSISLTPLDVDTILGKIKELIPTKESIEETVKQIVQPLLIDNEITRKQSIEAYKEQLLKTNEGRCIPELVEGSSKEELDKSLAKSIELYTKYNPHNIQDASQPALEGTFKDYLNGQEQQSGTPPPAETFYVPGSPVSDAIEGTDIKSLSQEEFAKQREFLAQEISRLVK